MEAKKKPEGKADKKSRKLKSECNQQNKGRDCCTEEAEKKQRLDKILRESVEREESDWNLLESLVLCGEQFFKRTADLIKGNEI